MPFAVGNALGSATRFQSHGGKLGVACVQCGKPMMLYRSDVARGHRFCSQSCAARAKIPRPRRRRRIECACPFCAGKMTLTPSMIRKGRRCCSNACRGQMMRRAARSEEQAFYASTEWSRARRAAYRRDGYRCQRCGNGQEAGKRVAHHLTPLQGLERTRWADVTLLVTLCVSCHNAVHEKFIVGNPRKRGRS